MLETKIRFLIYFKKNFSRKMGGVETNPPSNFFLIYSNVSNFCAH